MGGRKKPPTKKILSKAWESERIARILLWAPNPAVLQTAVFRDVTGRMTVHYLFSYERPEQNIVGSLPDKHLGYSLTLQTSVLTLDGRSVYEQNENLTGTVNDSQAAAARANRFVAQSRLPLPPGQYHRLP